MTTKELEERVQIVGLAVKGTKRIRITYRGHLYELITNNLIATDRIAEHYYGADDKEIICHYTYKQALQTLWDEFIAQKDTSFVVRFFG